MLVYRIVKSAKRTNDLSGTGAYTEGGRWNHEGFFALYTSESESLCMLEVLVHVDESELPPDMYILTIEINDGAPILEITDKDLPKDWRNPENIVLKEMGDKLFAERKCIAIKTRSAVMPNSYNYILNPTYPRYYDYVKVIEVKPLDVDQRFLELQKTFRTR